MLFISIANFQSFYSKLGCKEITWAIYYMHEKPITRPIAKEFIRGFLPDSPRILEAGAHIGRDTVKMARLWPDATIYAFEPVPDLFQQLKERTAGLPNIHSFQLALSNTMGTATMHVSTGASTAASSLFEPHEYRKSRPNVHFHPIIVHTITLDQWAEEQRIDHIDFLWLDMQGNELNVLKASTKIFPTARALLIEASFTQRFKGNPLYDEIIGWLATHGFKAIAQDEPKHDKVNIFFIRK